MVPAPTTAVLNTNMEPPRSLGPAEAYGKSAACGWPSVNLGLDQADAGHDLIEEGLQRAPQARVLGAAGGRQGVHAAAALLRVLPAALDEAGALELAQER